MTDTTATRPPDPPPGTPYNVTPTYSGPERRSALCTWCTWREGIDKRMDDGAHAMRGLRIDLDTNTAATARVEANTAELVGILNSAKGAFSVLEWLGKLAKPMGAIAALAASAVALWTSLKGGGIK